jgi:hypothetical protein
MFQFLYIPVPLQRPRNFCLGILDFEPACIAQLIQVEAASSPLRWFKLFSAEIEISGSLK